MGLKAFVAPALHGKTTLSMAYPNSVLDIDDIIRQDKYAPKINALRDEAVKTKDWSQHNNEVGIIMRNVISTLGDIEVVLLHADPKHYGLDDLFDEVYFVEELSDEEYNRRKEARLLTIIKEDRDYYEDLYDSNRKSHHYAVKSAHDDCVLSTDNFNLLLQ